MEQVKKQEVIIEKEHLDELAMGFQKVADVLLVKGAGEDLYTLARTLMVTMQRLRDSGFEEDTDMKKYVKEEESNIQSLIQRALGVSTESELESIKNELDLLTVHLQHKGI